MADMKEFRPCSALLVIWLAMLAVPFTVTGGIVANLCLESGGDAVLGFFAGAIPPYVIVGVIVVLYFSSIRYEISDDMLAKSSGVLWKARRTTPLSKITNVDVRRGPVERILGFGKVYIFTPSTGTMIPEVRLVGLRDPHAIRQLILDRNRPSSDERVAGPMSAGSVQDGETVKLLGDILRCLERIEAKTNAGNE